MFPTQKQEQDDEKPYKIYGEARKTTSEEQKVTSRLIRPRDITYQDLSFFSIRDLARSQRVCEAFHEDTQACLCSDTKKTSSSLRTADRGVSFSDLNSDTTLKIFSFLNLKELANISRANKQSRLNAIIAYKENFSSGAILAIIAAKKCSFALCLDGSVCSWGFGHRGLLGHGDNEDRNVPIPIAALADRQVTQLVLGDSQYFALCADGRVYSWGSGICGLLGHGDNEDRNVPTRIQALDAHQVTQLVVAEGGGRCFALCADGNVFSWGLGESRQLGHGDNRDRNVPTQIAALADRRVIQLVQVDDAHFHLQIFAVCADGGVYSWGRGGYGQLGHGNNEDRNVPTLIKGLPHFSDEKLSKVVQRHKPFFNEQISLFSHPTAVQAVAGDDVEETCTKLGRVVN